MSLVYGKERQYEIDIHNWKSMTEIPLAPRKKRKEGWRCDLWACSKEPFLKRKMEHFIITQITTTDEGYIFVEGVVSTFVQVERRK